MKWIGSNYFAFAWLSTTVLGRNAIDLQAGGSVSPYATSNDSNLYQRPALFYEFDFLTRVKILYSI